MSGVNSCAAGVNSRLLGVDSCATGVNSRLLGVDLPGAAAGGVASDHGAGQSGDGAPPAAGHQVGDAIVSRARSK